MLWVILAFVTNYIPNIGFVIAVIPPAILALLTGGWGACLAVIIAYCVINLTMQDFIQPKFVSDAVRLSLTLTFFSVVFWALVLGPIGAVLAIPATLLVRALLLDADPDAFWARSLSGDPADPPTRRGGGAEGQAGGREGRSSKTRSCRDAGHRETPAEPKRAPRRRPVGHSILADGVRQRGMGSDPVREGLSADGRTGGRQQRPVPLGTTERARQGDRRDPGSSTDGPRVRPNHLHQGLLAGSGELDGTAQGGAHRQIE